MFDDRKLKPPKKLPESLIRQISKPAPSKRRVKHPNVGPYKGPPSNYILYGKDISKHYLKVWRDNKGFCYNCGNHISYRKSTVRYIKTNKGHTRSIILCPDCKAIPNDKLQFTEPKTIINRGDLVKIWKHYGCKCACCGANTNFKDTEFVEKVLIEKTTKKVIKLPSCKDCMNKDIDDFEYRENKVENTPISNKKELIKVWKSQNCRCRKCSSKINFKDAGFKEIDGEIVALCSCCNDS